MLIIGKSRGRCVGVGIEGWRTLNVRRTIRWGATKKRKRDRALTPQLSVQQHSSARDTEFGKKRALGSASKQKDSAVTSTKWLF